MSEIAFRKRYEQLTDNELALVLADKQDLLPEAALALEQEVQRRKFVMPESPQWTRQPGSKERVASLEDYDEYQRLLEKKNTFGRYWYLIAMAPFALGLGLWVLLQSCALAWTRSGLSGLVSSRYTEFLVWGTVANAVAMVLILRGPALSGSRRAPSLAAMAIWLALVGGSEAWRSRTVYRPYFESFRAQTVEHEQRLGTFMRTGDAAVLEGVSSPRIPMYSGERLVSILGDPQVVAQLPAPMRRDQVRDRQPLLLAAEQDGPLCFAAIRLEGWGRGIAAAGLALIAGSFLLYRRVGPAARAPRP